MRALFLKGKLKRVRKVTFLIEVKVRECIMLVDEN